MRLPENEGATGWAVKDVKDDSHVTGWSAWVGDTYLASFDTGMETMEAVERVMGSSLRWVKDRTGVYRGVV